jgi:hypothetical protein
MIRKTLIMHCKELKISTESVAVSLNEERLLQENKFLKTMFKLRRVTCIHLSALSATDYGFDNRFFSTESQVLC